MVHYYDKVLIFYYAQEIGYARKLIAMGMN